MIQELITVLNAATWGLPVQERHGLAQVIGGSPHVHVGNGDWVPVTADQGGAWSYWRSTGQPRVEPTETGSPCVGVKITLPLRFVACLRRDACDDISDRLFAVVADIRGAKRSAQTATQASPVTFPSIQFGIDQVLAQEFDPVPQVPTDRIFVHIDLNIVLVGDEQCLSNCEPVDVSCRILQAMTNARIIACLGDRLAQVCPAQPESCPMTVRVYLNGVLKATIPDVDPCVNNTVNINGEL